MRKMGLLIVLLAFTSLVFADKASNDIANIIGNYYTEKSMSLENSEAMASNSTNAKSGIRDKIIEFAKTVKKLKPLVNTIAFNIFSLQNKTIVLHSNGVFAASNTNGIREISKCFSCKSNKYPEDITSNSQDYEINIDNFIINIKEEDGVYKLPINQGFELSKLELEELKDCNVINLNIAKLNSISKASRKIVFLNSDEPGIKASRKYNYPKCYVQPEKDPSDYIKNRKNDGVLNILIRLIRTFEKYDVGLQQ